MPEVAPLLVSLHIPKTGGGTLLEVLSTKFGDRLQRAYQPPRPGSSRSDSDGWPDIPDPQCIHGHAVVDRFGELIASCPTSRWITFLREPLASAVSFYHHMRRHVPWGPNRAAFDDRGLQHYVLHQYNHDRYTKNVDRCRAFAGEFFFVGVNERFDESLLVLYRLLDWDPIPYRPRNVGPYEDAALELRAVLRSSAGARMFSSTRVNLTTEATMAPKTKPPM